jgi:hypothetical protein
MAARFLLPDLPSELRNLVYLNSICPSEPASNAGLPFESKTFTSRHTEVVITPVHFADPSLLALEQHCFQEASEYKSFLLNNAIQLRIFIHFKGEVATFVQEDWDKKIATHLKNLLKKYPWLTKVVDYKVQILWNPTNDVKGQRRRSAGGIAKRMVEVLTGMMDEILKKRSGVVKAELQIDPCTVLHYAFLRQQTLGLADFISSQNVTTQPNISEVRVSLGRYRSQRTQPGVVLPSGFKPVLSHINEKRQWTDGFLVLTRETERKCDGTLARNSITMGSVDEAEAEGSERAFLTLAEECARAGDGSNETALPFRPR